MTHAAYKHQAHFLLDTISQDQLRAVVAVLEVMADPVSRRLSAAPIEDELISHREQAQASYAGGPWSTMDEIMEELGITSGDLEHQQHLMSAAHRSEA